MGFEWTTVTAELVELEFTVGPQHLQPYGLVHGGVHCGVVESVCSYGAALAAQERGLSGAVVGLENHTSFLRVAREGARLRCRGVPISRGRTTQLWEATIRDEADRVVATGRVRLLTVVPAELPR